VLPILGAKRPICEVSGCELDHNSDLVQSPSPTSSPDIFADEADAEKWDDYKDLQDDCNVS
jgi:hypothetical protein